MLARRRYASLLARNSRPDVRTALGFHHARGIALPFAVSPAGRARGTAELKISGSVDGCASLLPAVSSYYSPHCTNASGVMETRLVPTVALEQVRRYEGIDSLSSP